MGTVDFLLNSVLFCCEPLWFLFVSKNYMWWMLFGLVFSLYTVIGFIFFLDESPLFLLKRGEKEKAEKII